MFQCVKTLCEGGSFSVSLRTAGQETIDVAICVNGVLAIGPDNAGRGINAAVIHEKSGRVIQTAHFDTYRYLPTYRGAVHLCTYLLTYLHMHV